MARGKYERLATGVYEDQGGRRIVVTLGGKQFERRFPFTATIEFLIAQRKRFQSEMEGDHPELTKGAAADGGPRLSGPTVQAGIDTYLATLPHTIDADGTIKGGHQYSTPRAACAHWAAAFGPATRLAAVTDATALAAVAQWKTLQLAGQPGHAADTINKRTYMLRAIVRLSCPGRPNPADAIPHQAPPPPRSRDVAIDVIQAIFDALPADGPTAPCKATARLRVQAETGFPPAVIKRIDPKKHILRATRAVYVLGRMKGKRELPAQWITVTPEAIDAFDQLAAVNGFGKFSTRSVAKSFARAVARAKDRWENGHGDTPPNPMAWDVPIGIRAYDLRHAFLTAFYKASGGDIVATGRAGLHAVGSRTTDRYIVGGVDAAQQAAADRLSAQRPAAMKPKAAPAANVVAIGVGRTPKGGRP